jgi:hypothetical protein
MLYESKRNTLSFEASTTKIRQAEKGGYYLGWHMSCTERDDNRTMNKLIKMKEAEHIYLALQAIAEKTEKRKTRNGKSDDNLSIVDQPGTPSLGRSPPCLLAGFFGQSTY